MTRVVRSFLFAPGSDRRKMEKALASRADAVILDLEDAVAPDRKEAARTEVAAFLRERFAPDDAAQDGLRPASPRPAVFVRVNAVGTTWFEEDLRAVAVPGLAGVMVPKVDGAETARRAARAVRDVWREVRRNTGMSVGSGGAAPELLPLVESAAGLWNFTSIAAAIEEGLGGAAHASRAAFGGVDFALDVGATVASTNPVQAVAKALLVIQSRVLGWHPPVDTIYTRYRDLAGLRREAEEARDLGMFGKLAIHPAQVDVIQEVFTPGEGEIEEARRIVEAYEAGLRAKSGVSGLGGQMVERPVAERARRLLALAEAIRGR